MKAPKMFTPSEKNPNALNLKSILVPFLFSLVCGILLIAFQSWTLKITSWILSALMIGWGGWLIFKYFKSETMERITGSNMASGLALLVSGILLACSPDFLKDFLPFIWGLSMLFGAFLKIQYAFDERTVGVEKWWMMLIFAAVSLIFAILSLLRPGFFGDSVEIIVGIFLIAEAILDVVVFILLNKAMKEKAPKITYSIPNEPAQAVPAAPAAEPAPAAPAPAAPAAPAAPVPASPAPAPVPEAAPAATPAAPDLKVPAGPDESV